MSAELSVRAAAREAPGEPALILAGRAIDYATLAGEVHRMLLALRAEGLLAKEPIAFIGRSDPEALALAYALVEAGLAMLPVHPRLTAHERAELLDRLAPAAMIEPSRLRGSPRFEKPVEPGAAERVEPIDEKRPLAILHTSGTTGAPKGIVLSRRAFIQSARASEKNLGWRPDDRWLLGLPIAHVGGLSVLTRCLIAKKPVVVPQAVARGEQLGPDELVSTIERERVTLVSLVPTQLERLLSVEPKLRAPPHLRAILLGGAAASGRLLSLAADRGFPVLTTYGLTEACSQVTTQPYGTVQRGEAGAGKPLSGIQIKIDGDQIAIRGDTLLSGYHPPRSRPALDPGGWLRTGDAGYFDAAGNLHVIGRRTELIVTGGENVYPAEVEQALERFPGVKGACAFGVDDDEWGQRVAAAIVVSGEFSSERLRRELAERVAPHKRPRLVAIVDELATTEAGKLDRAATAARARPALRQLAEL